MSEYFQELRERLDLPGYDPHRNIKKALKFIAILAILIVLGFGGWRLFRVAQDRFSTEADVRAAFMGTNVEIVAYGEGAGDSAREALKEMERVAGLLDVFDPRSEVSLINSMSGVASVSVSKATFDVINKSVKFSKMADGAFDISVGPLVDIWDFSGRKNFRIPAPEQIREAQALVDWSEIELLSDVLSVKLRHRGMKLNLGGVGKGYVVSIGRNVLLQAGIKSALISTGSSISCIGRRPDGTPWRAGIKSPREPEKLLGAVTIEPGQSISTSGDYEKYVIIDGKRYHHILDPRTGYPAALCEAVTVISDDATASDILSTAVFVMGPQKGLRFLNKLGNVQALIVDSDGVTLTTPGFKLEKSEEI